jgi:hypothetical protein
MPFPQLLDLDSEGNGKVNKFVLAVLGNCRTSSTLNLSFQLWKGMADSPQQIEIFDSLPYYDNDLQNYPQLKEKVDQELARQPKPPSTIHPRVPPPYELFAVREQDSEPTFRSQAYIVSHCFLEKPFTSC